MAKMSSINKNNKRIKLSNKYYSRRKKLKWPSPQPQSKTVDFGVTEFKNIS